VSIDTAPWVVLPVRRRKRRRFGEKRDRARFRGLQKSERRKVHRSVGKRTNLRTVGDGTGLRRGQEKEAINRIPYRHPCKVHGSPAKKQEKRPGQGGEGGTVLDIGLIFMARGHRPPARWKARRICATGSQKKRKGRLGMLQRGRAQ